MLIKLNENNVNYEVYGEGKNIIMLHGWGCDLDIFNKYHNLEDYKVYIIDLPGFGLSSKPKRIYNTLDYVNVLNDFINELNIENPILMGHSFGGKVVLKYLSIYNLEKGIVISPSAFKPKRKLDYYIKVYTYKIVKKLGFNLNMGSTDYKKADGIMRGILSKVVNEDLSDDCLKIKSNVLIIWGANDTTVSIDDAYKLEELISDSGVVIIPNTKHYPFIENERYFKLVLQSFISDEE